MGNVTAPRDLRRAIERAIQDQHGVIFARPAIVHRNTYRGRGIIADNSRFDTLAADERGFLPVEWWIMSLTEAGNSIPKAGEGITELALRVERAERRIPLTDAVAAAGDLLFGGALAGTSPPFDPVAAKWPLIKLLDIGGESIRPTFSDEPEVPPIPVHVHGGTVVRGRVVKPGKLEAYFFPPTDVGPYRIGLGDVWTRLGLRPGTTPRAFLKAVGEFGVSDAMYDLLPRFPIRPYDGWIIPPGVVHAPGPWPTIEIQTPQDDFNLLAWQMGERLETSRRRELFDALVLRGLPSEASLLAEIVDWELSTAPGFRERFFRPAREIEAEDWGRRLRIFFDRFDGEAIEIGAGKTWKRDASAGATAAFLWSGEGVANGMKLSASRPDRRELLLAPGYALDLANASGERLIVCTFGPMID
jgi:hypothetical protein